MITVVMICSYAYYVLHAPNQPMLYGVNSGGSVGLLDHYATGEQVKTRLLSYSLFLLIHAMYLCRKVFIEIEVRHRFLSYYALQDEEGRVGSARTFPPGL